MKSPTAAPDGAVFYREKDGVTANALLSKMREDGEMSDVDPRSLRGFGDQGLVGVAIHPPRAGFWAVVDSADGCQGIKSGGWSRVALAANHLATDAIWYRAYSDQVALAARFKSGGTFFEVFPGDRRVVLRWLEKEGMPIAEAAPPAAAGKEAVLATIEYDEKSYRTGPDAGVAAKLVAIASALRRGNAGELRALCEELAPEQLPLALAVIRGARDGHWRYCLEELATAMLAEPMVPRAAVKEMTLAEEVLRRVASVSADRFAACLERLDAIESEAEGRSTWANPNGVALLGGHFFRTDPARSFECYRRLLMRTDEPAWWTVNHALGTLLTSTRGALALMGDAAEVVRRCEARVSDLGESAQDAIHYNLACVYARAGELERALELLRLISDLRAQNPHPEQDTDLEPLWGRPELLALIEKAPEEGEADDDEEDEEGEDDDEEERVEYVPPPDRAIPRQAIKLRPGSGSALVSRMGGLPNAPTADGPWPHSRNRPMRFILQLVGRAAGGEVDLGDATLLQIFADMDGDYYDPGFHTVVIHRGATPATLTAPVGVDVEPVKLIDLAPGNDDRVLLDVDFPDEDDALYEAHQKARRHAWADKLWGIPVGANLDPDERDREGRPMRCLLQLVTYDDWFLWYVFASGDLSEARLQIVRG